ncbi:gliding motility lipoprotein GldB [Cytophaga hutchinsonii]|nr:gliding motility lipoprotein GldB [Cytophaga hutchinsonii]
MKFWVAILFTAILFSCEPDKPVTNSIEKQVIKPEAAEEVSINASIVRIDKDLFAMTKKEDMEKIFLTYPAFFKQYLRGIANKPMPEDVERMYQYYNNPGLKGFATEIEAAWGDMSAAQKELTSMFRYMKFYMNAFKEPKVYTIYSGLMEPDMSFSDSAIVVCLDWYMGPKASHKPNLYEYMLSRYDKPYLLPMMALGISTKFNKNNPADETLLAEMIYYGKAHYFVERVMPDLPDSLNIGYTSKELKGVDENLPVIWGHFIDRKILFETSRKIVEQYTGEGPFVNEISNDCPGRVGRWLGWQIVRKYMNEHPDISLQELMDEQDAAKIFKLSGYKPPLKK